MSESDRNTALGVGVFMIVGLACVGYLALRMGGVGLPGDERYILRARFVSASGLRPGAPVELAGVRVGEVAGIRFVPELYQAEVSLRVEPQVRLQEDAIASIRTAGIIGEKFVKLSPGGAERYLEPGAEILETEPSINLEELISKYVFEGSGGS